MVVFEGWAAKPQPVHPQVQYDLFALNQKVQLQSLPHLQLSRKQQA